MLDSFLPNCIDQEVIRCFDINMIRNCNNKRYKRYNIPFNELIKLRRDFQKLYFLAFL